MIMDKKTYTVLIVLSIVMCIISCANLANAIITVKHTKVVRIEQGEATVIKVETDENGNVYLDVKE